MVRTKSFLKRLPSMQGHTIMEVAVLLLLTIPMSTTTPVRQTQRTQTESLSLMKSIQRSRDMTLIDTDRDRETPSVVTKTTRKTHLNATSSLLLQTILQKARERRAAQRGCQLGTCQVHNLASKLYRMGQSNGKEESKNANDPTGYGR
uniref:Adrenomedullin n=1 Tax=Sinocyclocheilus rhinocerous TaxID=307959 RepID=A0A673G179_9TELE